MLSAQSGRSCLFFMVRTMNLSFKVIWKPSIPWFCGTGMDDAVTTAAWTDEEAEGLAIQPAKALALAAAAVGGKGYTH